MVKNYFAFILLILISGGLMAQDNGLWTRADMNLSEMAVEQDFEVKKSYQAFELELGSLKNKLFSGLQDQSGLQKIRDSSSVSHEQW